MKILNIKENKTKTFLLLSAGALLLVFALYIFQNRYALTGIFFQTFSANSLAISNYTKAIETNKGDAYSYYQLGLIYKETGNYDMAGKVYKELLQIFPNHPDANYDLGYIYKEKGLSDHAIKQYQKALAVDPKNAYAQYDIASIYRQRGELDTALKEYEKVIKIDPNHPYAYYDIGQIYEELGMKGEADEAFKTHHDRTDPNFIDRFLNKLTGKGNG